MHVVSKEVQEKSKQLKQDIISYLESCENNISSFKDMILTLKKERARIKRTIESINIEGKCKIKVNRINRKNITFQLILNEKN
jgi:archaellum component FlaC